MLEKYTESKWRKRERASPEMNYSGSILNLILFYLQICNFFSKNSNHTVQKDVFSLWKYSAQWRGVEIQQMSHVEWFWTKWLYWTFTEINTSTMHYIHEFQQLITKVFRGGSKIPCVCLERMLIVGGSNVQLHKPENIRDLPMVLAFLEIRNRTIIMHLNFTRKHFKK